MTHDILSAHEALCKMSGFFDTLDIIEKKNPWWSQQGRDELGRWSKGYVHGSFSPVDSKPGPNQAAPHIGAAGTPAGPGGELHGKTGWQFEPKAHGQAAGSSKTAPGVAAPKGDPERWGFTVGGGSGVPGKKPGAVTPKVGTPEGQDGAADVGAAHLQGIHDDKATQIPTSTQGLGQSFGQHVQPTPDPALVAAGSVPGAQPGADGAMAQTEASPAGAQAPGEAAERPPEGTPDISGWKAPEHPKSGSGIEVEDERGRLWSAAPMPTFQSAQMAVNALNNTNATAVKAFVASQNDKPVVMVPHHVDNGGPAPGSPTPGADDGTAPAVNPSDTSAIPGATGAMTQGFHDVEGWNPTEGHKTGGTNPGGFFEAPDGSKHYVKFYKNPDQAKVEYVANEIYRQAGINAPKSSLVRIGDGLGVANAVVPGGEHQSKESVNGHADVKSGFVADAFLANHDVLGMNHDNILTDASGKAHRIDNGGSMVFRAQGAMKGYSPSSVPELQTMRDPEVAHQAAQAFKGLTDEDVAKQAKEFIQHVAPHNIDDIVNSSGLSTEFKTHLKTALSGRYKALEDFAAAHEPQQSFDDGSGPFDDEAAGGTSKPLAHQGVIPMVSDAVSDALKNKAMFAPTHIVNSSSTPADKAAFAKYADKPITTISAVKDFANNLVGNNTNSGSIHAALLHRFHSPSNAHITANILNQLNGHKEAKDFHVVDHGDGTYSVKPDSIFGKVKDDEAVSGAKSGPKFDAQDVFGDAQSKKQSGLGGTIDHSPKWFNPVATSQSKGDFGGVSHKELTQMAASSYGEETTAQAVAALLGKNTGKEWKVEDNVSTGDHGAQVYGTYKVTPTSQAFDPESKQNKYMGLPDPNVYESGDDGNAPTVLPDDLGSAHEVEAHIIHNAAMGNDNLVKWLKQYKASHFGGSEESEKSSTGEAPSSTNGAWSGYGGGKLDYHDSKKANSAVRRLMKGKPAHEIAAGITSSPLVMRYLANHPQYNSGAYQKLADAVNSSSAAYHAQVVTQKNKYGSGNIYTIHFSHYGTVGEGMAAAAAQDAPMITGKLKAAMKSFKDTGDESALVGVAHFIPGAIEHTAMSGPMAKTMASAVNHFSDKYGAFVTTANGKSHVHLVDRSKFLTDKSLKVAGDKPTALPPEQALTSKFDQNAVSEGAPKPMSDKPPAAAQAELDAVGEGESLPSNASMAAKLSAQSKHLPAGIARGHLTVAEPEKQQSTVATLAGLHPESAKWLADHYNRVNAETQHPEHHEGKMYPGKALGFPNVYATPTQVMHDIEHGGKTLPPGIKPHMLYAATPQEREAIKQGMGYGISADSKKWLNDFFDERDHAENYAQERETNQSAGETGAPAWHHAWNNGVGGGESDIGDITTGGGKNEGLWAPHETDTNEKDSAAAHKLYNQSPVPLESPEMTVDGKTWDMRGLSPSEIYEHDGTQPTGGGLKAKAPPPNTLSTQAIGDAMRQKIAALAPKVKAQVKAETSDLHGALPTGGVHADSAHAYKLSQKHYPAMLALARAAVPSKGAMQSLLKQAATHDSHAPASESPRGRMLTTLRNGYFALARQFGVKNASLQRVDESVHDWKGDPASGEAPTFRIMANMLAGAAPWDNVSIDKSGKAARDYARNRVAQRGEGDFMAVLAHKAMAQAIAERMADDEGDVPLMRGLGKSEWQSMQHGTKSNSTGDKLHGSSKSHAGFTTNKATAHNFGHSGFAVLRHVQPKHIWQHHLAPTSHGADVRFDNEREAFVAAPKGGEHYIYRSTPQLGFKENQVFSRGHLDQVGEHVKSKLGLFKMNSVRGSEAADILK